MVNNKVKSLMEEHFALSFFDETRTNQTEDCFSKLHWIEYISS